MTGGSVVRIVGTVAPLMVVEKIEGGVAHLAWFWGSALRRQTARVEDLELISTEVMAA